jgi:hypothetical protein
MSENVLEFRSFVVQVLSCLQFILALAEPSLDKKYVANEFKTMTKIAHRCSRRSVPYQHAVSYRDHGFFCSACRLGEKRHTGNCTGRENEVTLGHLQNDLQLGELDGTNRSQPLVPTAPFGTNRSQPLERRMQASRITLGREV